MDKLVHLELDVTPEQARAIRALLTPDQPIILPMDRPL